MSRCKADVILEQRLYMCSKALVVSSFHTCVAFVDIYVPCNLETSRRLQTAPCSLQTARWPCSLQTACHAVCRLRGHRFNELHARVCFGEITSKKTERIVMIYSAVLCEKLGGHFGSRESSSSQPFIPCEQTCHCFPQLQARKRIITIVKKTEVIFL